MSVRTAEQKFPRRNTAWEPYCGSSRSRAATSLTSRVHPPSSTASRPILLSDLSRIQLTAPAPRVALPSARSLSCRHGVTSAPCAVASRAILPMRARAPPPAHLLLPPVTPLVLLAFVTPSRPHVDLFDPFCDPSLTMLAHLPYPS